MKDSDYHHLSQCETLEDVRLNLAETDFGSSIANDSSVSPAIIERRSMEKLVKEFQYLQTQATEPLTTFLEYIRIEYILENIMLLLRGTISGRNVNELMQQCHPLGIFNENALRNIPTFEATPKGYAELYETVLVDTPVGKYFQQYLDASGAMFGTASDMRNVLEEVQIEILKHSLSKYYIEDFYTFCSNLGGDSSEIMCSLLSARADRAAINITLNSFGTPLNEPHMRDTLRKRLYPSIGELYPAGTDLLSRADDEQKLTDSLRAYQEYHPILEKMTSLSADEYSIDDAFYKKEVRLCEFAFESQMHFGSFYAYVKLKEQEIRNLVYISECILQRRKDAIGNYIPIFSKNSEWRCESTRRNAVQH